MALIAYETDYDWFPDRDIVNARVNPQYSGWRLAADKSLGKAVWTFSPLIENPVPIEEVLPPMYKVLIIEDNSSLRRMGYAIRNLAPNFNIGTN